MHRITSLLLALAACGGSDRAGTASPPPPPPPQQPEPAPIARGPAAAPATPTITAYVRGPLATADLATARIDHDRVAKGGQGPGAALGDTGHHVFLATGETGNAKDEFLALDEWTNADGPRQLYANPDFQAAFKPLFAKPTAPELYRRRPDWVTWGDLQPPPGGKPYWVLIVKGHLAKATEAENKAAHDKVASTFEAIAKQSGDFAHVPHLAVDDPRIFFNVDASTNHDAMLAMMKNPDFQKAFSALFDAPPEVHLYRSTDWYQW
ncbi:MAG TPA: hypothetical protein VFQ53_16140 [Kofleriaceae bacterium]|nr:hypothetical protein [Kofleriaceae bacterium]